MASGWKISNCGATMRLFWMAWAHNAFRIRTTSGDFTRRFEQEAIVDLMEAINSTRQRVWKEQPRGFLSHAFIDTATHAHRRCGHAQATAQASWIASSLFASLNSGDWHHEFFGK